LRHVIFGIFDNFKAKLEFNHSISLLDTVPVYAPVRPGSLQHADRREPGRNSSAFIYSRQCYGPGPVWGTNLSRYVAVMLRFATVHSRCRSGGATVCPGVSRYENRRQSPGVTAAGHGSRAAKPRCFTVAYEYQWFFLEPYNRNVICKVQNSIYILRQKNSNASGREDR